MRPEELAALITAEALGLGFQRIGFAPVEPWARHVLYERWLAAGHHGTMDYLAADAVARRDPRALLADARTVVTVALSYAHAEPTPIGPGPHGFIARYARGPDYHVVIKQRLTELARTLSARLGRPIASRACVDTAPLLEREAAHRAGLGFLAKNTMVIAPGLGSYILLGELLLDVEAAPSHEATPRCGQCRACLDVCPTGAIVDAYTLDARRCISYLTIESRGPIPRDLRPAIGDMIFGCDRCQEVCPFNAQAPAGSPLLAPRPGRARPPLVELLGLGAARFRKYVARTAMRRIHRAQLLRNVAVALGNVGGPEAISPLVQALGEPAALVRSHVVWALGQIARRHPDSSAQSALRSHRAMEKDPAVLEELDRFHVEMSV